MDRRKRLARERIQKKKKRGGPKKKARLLQQEKNGAEAIQGEPRPRKG